MSEALIPPPAQEDNVTVMPTERRGRGRPRKNPTADAPDNSAKPDAARTAEKPKRRKKGMPSGDEIVQRAQVLAGIHQTLAFFIQAPELIINEQEAMALASASLNAEREFGIELDGKAVCAVTLLATAAQVYAPKFFAMKKRVETQREEAKKNPEPETMNAQMAA